MMSKAAEKKMPTEELSMQPVSHLDVETVVLDQKIKETFCQRNLGLIKQTMVVSVLNLCQLNIGLGLGFSAVSLPQIKNEMTLSTTSEGAYAGFLSLGQICGSLVTALVSDSIGRKGTALVSCFPSMIGWICVGLPSSNILILTLGRFLVGLGMGIEGSLHSLYVNELVKKGWRGSMVASGVLTITFGILIVFILGSFIHYHITAWICFSVAVLALLLLAFLVPESPLWLVQKTHYDLADNVINFLGRNQDLEFASEVEEQLRANLKESSKSTKVLSSRVILPTLTLIILFFLQNWTGFIATIFYGVTIFTQVSPQMDPYYATIILGTVQLLGCILSMFLIKMVTGKRLLLVSLSLCCLTMTCLAISVHLQWHWAALASLLSFTFSFMTGLSPIPWILVGQLPTEMKGAVAGLSTAFCYFFIFLGAFTFPFMNGWQLWNKSFGTFLFYACVAFLGIFYVGCCQAHLEKQQQKQDSASQEQTRKKEEEEEETVGADNAGGNLSIIHHNHHQQQQQRPFSFLNYSQQNGDNNASLTQNEGLPFGSTMDFWFLLKKMTRKTAADDEAVGGGEINEAFQANEA